MLDAGADVKTKTELGRTALKWAAGKRHAGTVALMLDHGADVNAKTELGRTALMSASWVGDVETVALLLDRGADVNAKTEDGDTALMEAARGGNVEIVALLLDRGAVVNAKMWWGDTVMTSARENVKPLLLAAEQARSLAATLDSARPPDTVPEPPARARLSNDPMNRPREDLGAPDPMPIKPGRVRL
jgi:predicted LPLAT superfamily acyltransferase